VSEKLVDIDIDIPQKDQEKFAVLGVRLALLQAVFDVTYMEIFSTLEDKYKDRMAYRKEEKEE
jgi:hypothetical protein